MLTGFYPLDAGAIILDGKNVEQLRPNERLALGLMRTFQVPKLFNDMTVLENLLVPALSDSQHHRRTRSEVMALAEESLEFASISHIRHLLAKQISGGQKMLLQIMRGFMVSDLALYVMDEPFTGINPVLKDIIIDAIVKMNRERGVTFPHRQPRDADHSSHVPGHQRHAQRRDDRGGRARRGREQPSSGRSLPRRHRCPC